MDDDLPVLFANSFDLSKTWPLEFVASTLCELQCSFGKYEVDVVSAGCKCCPQSHSYAYC